MLKLLWMKGTVEGVSSLKFIGLRHINADIRLISTKSSPEFSSPLAEGDGRAPIFTQQEVGPAEAASDNLNWKGSPAGRLTVFPKRSFHRHKVVPQSGDEQVFEGIGGRWPGR
jgi:hypothetical protein